MRWGILKAVICIMLMVAGTLILYPVPAFAAEILKSNTTPVNIPDDGTRVFSRLEIRQTTDGVPKNAVVTGIDIHFSATHPRSGDLQVYLVYAPVTGELRSKYFLWSNEGGTAPNPSKTVTGITKFNGLGVNSTWTVCVKDTVSGQSGVLNECWIKVYYSSASGSGSTIYSVNSSILESLTEGTDDNDDGYMESYQFLMAIDIVAPDGINVLPKIICDTTGQSWYGSAYNNDHVVPRWDETYFPITRNTDLAYTVELWDSTKTTRLATSQVSNGPIKAGVYYDTYGAVNNWTPGTDFNGDGYYDTYQFQIGVDGDISVGPDDVTARVVCTTTGQSWWASAPWTITGATPDYHYFDFTEADFAGQIGGKTTLNFAVELWDAAKTTKLGSATFDTSMLKVNGTVCSVAVNNFSASGIPFDPYTGGNTTFSADISASPSVTWQLDINGDIVATGNTTTVSQPWHGKNSIGRILDPGTYTATLTATDPSGQCSDSKTVSVTIFRKSDNPSGCMLQADSGSTTSVASGDVNHSQELFSLKGGALPTSITLFYNSLNPYDGPLGLGWSHTYDISLTENPDGSILLREGNGGKSLYAKSGTNYIPPPGDFSTLVKNGDGTYIITFRNGNKFSFTQNGKIASLADRFNNIIMFGYTSGDLTTITDSSQRASTIAYDTSVTPHRIKTVTDSNLKTYDFAYQGNTLWKVTNPVADPEVSPVRGYWEYIYDPQGFLKSKRDPNGNLTQYTYYSDHRLEKSIDPEGTTDPNGHTRTFIYPTTTDSLRTTTLVEKDGGNWFYTYDAQAGVLKQKTAPNGTFTSYSYYPNGYIKSKTEPKDGAVRLTTFYTYDSYGNVLTETDPVDLSSYNPAIDPETVSDPSTLASLDPPIKPAFRYTYDYANYDQIQSISNERGATPTTTGYLYTEEGGFRVTRITDPESHVTVHRYNANGTVKDITDANSKVVSFDYYPNGLLKSSTDLNEVVTSFTSYDGNGNVLKIKVKDTDEKELTSSFAVDALNRITKITKLTTAFPANITRYGYDLGGNRTSVIDAESRETKYEYRYDGQVKKIINAKQKDTQLFYGTSGCGACGGGVDKLTAITDARLQTTGFFYDHLGRLEHETDALGKTIRFTYYDSGRIKEKIDASATPEKILITYTHDDLGRLTKKHYYDGSEETYGYNAKGHLETTANQYIGYTFDYYDNGWLKSVTDSTGKKISYDQYDGIGQREKVTILAGSADQRVINYDYDSANRLWYITSPAGTFTFTYDASGRRDTITYPNQIIADYDFDDLDRLTNLTHGISGGATFLNYNYTHDQVGNRKTRTGTSPESYDYDELYRLKQAITAKGTENFDYDEVGNRKSGPGFKDTDYVHNAANRMTSGRKMGYAYDNFGNQTARITPNAPEKTWTQTWDYENRLVKVERIKGSERKTVTFKYDPFGRRIEKKLVTVIDGVTNTSTWGYIYDNEDIVQEVLADASGTTKTFFTHGPGIDEPLALERSGQFFYYHSDGLGSITAITDAGRNMVQSYGYDSLGLAKPATGFANSYTFTGREWDKETGLYCYRARYYDPMEGRFISRDPAGFIGGINLYSYVQNNSINWIDPEGLKYAEIWGGTGAVVGGTIVAGGSIVADAFTGGLNILATPAEIGAGAALGGAIGYGLGNFLDWMMNEGESSDNSKPNISPGGACPNGPDDNNHFNQRRNEAKASNKNRQIGDHNRTIQQGQEYVDTETGNTVYVRGNKVVITDSAGNPITQFKNTRANTLMRIQKGRWVPK